jgi:hypothetical protein
MLNDKIKRIIKKMIEEKEVKMQKTTCAKKRSPPSMFM